MDSVLSANILSHDSSQGGASCPVTGAVFKTVSECARAYLGGFDSHTPPPFRIGIWDLGFGI
jgi:hypothetical protein